MTSTTRIQNRYDHLLREHVRSTDDVNYAIQLGVPRSTARGWVNSTPAEVVTLDIVDMDNVRLQQQVLRLQSRLDWVVAVLRLVIVVLKASGISLSNIRIPEGTAKLMLLRAVLSVTTFWTFCARSFRRRAFLKRNSALLAYNRFGLKW